MKYRLHGKQKERRDQKGEWYTDPASTMVFSKEGKTICIIQSNDGEGKSNARLIAQAPKMYEALKKAKRRIEYTSHRTDEVAVRLIDELESILAEVEGK